MQGGSNGAAGAAVPGATRPPPAQPGRGVGTITLASVTTAVDPSVDHHVIDKVGCGTATRREGTAAPARLANEVALAQQHAASTPTTTARTSRDRDARAVNTGVATPPVDPPAAGDKTIAEIQGTGTESPIKGSTVTTTGVVTAAFPTGGFDGFYIQTGGPDTTPGASDGALRLRARLQRHRRRRLVQVSGTVKEFSGADRARRRPR